MTKKTNEVSQKLVNSFFDRGDGVVEFPNGLVITDDSVMWSGTKYDIESLDINEYPGQLTLDHWDSIGGDTLIGKVEGVHKQGNKILVDRIRYAINASENAKRAYNLLVGGFSNAFSIETIGPWADEEDRTMYNHKLVGLSQVVMGNNKHAVANSIDGVKRTNEKGEEESTEDCVAKHEIRVEQAMEEPPVEEEDKDMSQLQAKAESEQKEVLETLDAELEAETCNDATPAEEATDAPEADAEATEAPAEAEEAETEESVAEEPKVERTTVSHSAEKNQEESAEGEKAEADTDETEVTNSAEEAEEPTEDAETEADKVENQAEEPAETEEEEAEEQPKEENALEETKTNNTAEEFEMSKEEIQKMINEAFKNFAEAQVASAEVKEPEVKVENDAPKDEPYTLEAHANLILRALKTRSAVDYDKLARVNNANLEALKAAGKVNNAMTIEDWGNFVLPPEMYDKLVGGRTDYSAILNATDWRETDRLEFAWLTRNGDIEMKNTAMCEARPADSSDTSNLKPISEYGAVQHIEQMEHLAAITPVCSAATKYLVVDLVADAIAGYRNNYDKKRAELVIAKLQEAVNETGNKVKFNTNGTADTKLTTFIETMAELSNVGASGSFIFTEKTLLKVMEYVSPRESALGDRVFDAGTDGIKRIFGTPYIVVPNSLMPSLEGTGANPVFSYIPKDASSTAPVNIEITSTVFYGDLSQFTGYTSGGLVFDMTEMAAYELPDGTVRSAYQRDEIVLRGYFYRGAAYRYPQAMAAITNEK